MKYILTDGCESCKKLQDNEQQKIVHLPQNESKRTIRVREIPLQTGDQMLLLDCKLTAALSLYARLKRVSIREIESV